jgi:glycosyltransferase involved in cell wall biosynthesis
MKRLVVNAVNLSSRGGRSVLAACLDAIETVLPAGWDAEAYICSTDGIPDCSRIKLTVVPRKWNAWLDRIWFELKGLYDLEAGRVTDVFLSLQGTSARIDARMKAVYCHQNLPLAPMPLRVAMAQPSIAIRRLAYDALYRFAIGKKAIIILQQQVTREAFAKRYGLCRSIVAHPYTGGDGIHRWRRRPVGTDTLRLLYPAGPYPNKDIGILCEAVRHLLALGIDVEATITVSPDDNTYTRALAARYAGVTAIRFVGLLSRLSLAQAYQSHDLLVFPSLVESWGLPLSEGKAHGIGIVAADLPYAHETVGAYDAVSFFRAGNADQLAAIIADYWTGASPLSHSDATIPREPFVRNWDELIRSLTSFDENVMLS